MTSARQQELILQFNECINRRDADGLAALMTPDHTFIDTAHHAIHGSGKALEAWRGFSSAFPDYRNVFDSLASNGDLVSITGHSTCSDERLDGPAIWTARVRDLKIAEWRVYDDTPENRKLLGIPY
jgi:ketosteroid isomerase-like protein